MIQSEILYCFFWPLILSSVSSTVQELRPTLKMLVPIWKALCAVIGTDQSEMMTEEEHVVAG